MLWTLTWLLLFRPSPRPAHAWRRLLLRIFGAKLGRRVHPYPSAKIWAPWNLKLGHNAWLGPHVICYNQALVELEDNATVSQYSYLCTAGHDSRFELSPHHSLITAPIIIKRSAWIGTKAFIGMGVCIGEGAIVGATASVYKSVDKMTIVGGNPAKFIKNREINA